jgi:hypothetical protein
MADAAPTQTLLQHRTALQEELSAQLAQMAGQLRSNAECFSNALAADQAVLRNAEEKIGANFDVGAAARSPQPEPRNNVSHDNKCFRGSQSRS